MKYERKANTGEFSSRGEKGLKMEYNQATSPDERGEKASKLGVKCGTEENNGEGQMITDLRVGQNTRYKIWFRR